MPSVLQSASRSSSDSILGPPPLISLGHSPNLHPSSCHSCSCRRLYQTHKVVTSESPKTTNTPITLSHSYIALLDLFNCVNAIELREDSSLPTFPKALHPPILLLKKELGPPSLKHNQFWSWSPPLIRNNPSIVIMASSYWDAWGLHNPRILFLPLSCDHWIDITTSLS